ncbi:MAG: hypothetical protein LBB93_04470 [Elusimicrobiota bacterium]|jgi:hypothetical protein|nr:hypothetical protein [Elusimicrobiota bacterium]
MRKNTIKNLFFALTVVILSTLSVQAAEKYVVFFAQTAEIPQDVLNLINNSKQFCLNVPLTGAREPPEALEELISTGKIELSLTFIPEPVFPALLSVYNQGGLRSERMEIFESYISGNKNDFRNNVRKNNFGLFLSNGIVSDPIVRIFAKENLRWINISNSSTYIRGIYNVSGLNSFFTYPDFPNNAQDALRWIASRNGTVIPVILTPAHLQNRVFMRDLITALDNRRDIRPASPLYISLLRKDLIRPAPKTLAYKGTRETSSIVSALNDAVATMIRYKKSKQFSEPLFKNAQDELVYMCNLYFLDNNTVGDTAFDAAYANIFRLLNGEVPINAVETQINEPPPILEEGAERAVAIDNGIRVESEGGSIRYIDLFTSAQGLTIDIIFTQGRWDNNVDYVELYIDMNRIDNMGLTSSIGGTASLTPSSAWEFALKITKRSAVLYRATQNAPVAVAEFNVDGGGRIVIPVTYLNGNPKNWGIQALAIKEKSTNEKSLLDYLSRNEIEKIKVLRAGTAVFTTVRLRR